MKLSSQTIFKATVFLLGIPAVIFLPIATLAIVFRLVGSPGIGGFAFGVTGLQLRLVAALLGIFILLAFLGVTLFYRHSRRKQESDSLGPRASRPQ